MALFYIFTHLSMRLFSIFCLLLSWDKWRDLAFLDKNSLQQKEQTDRLVRSKETTNMVSSHHRTHKPGWWHMPWIAGWPGVTHTWSDSGLLWMHDNRLCSAVYRFLSNRGFPTSGKYWHDIHRQHFYCIGHIFILKMTK